MIRSGYGISYIHFNRTGSADLLAINGPQVVSALVNQVTAFGTPSFIPTQNGYPDGLTAPNRLDPKIANLAYIPRDFRDAYVQNWVVSIQREILKDTILDVGYVGNSTTNLITIADFNQARPCARARRWPPARCFRGGRTRLSGR